MNDQNNIKNYKGYLGNQLIKRAGVQIEWNQETLTEYLKCSKNPVYFAENYMNIVDADGNLQKIKLYDYQKEIISSLHNNRRTIVLTARQAGKALPLDTPIATPDGYKTMGELKVDDYVFDENGNPTRVTSVSDIFHNNDCYKITFDDGASVIADADHLWSLHDCFYNSEHSWNRKEIYIKTTKQMYDLGATAPGKSNGTASRWFIPLCKPLNFNKKEVSLDPYVLGYWLAYIPNNYGRGNCPPLPFEADIEYQLKSYNLINNKHIPSDFLFNDTESRIQLLRGIMDAAGVVNVYKQVNYISCRFYSSRLIDDFYTLLTGLGFKVKRMLKNLGGRRDKNNKFPRIRILKFTCTRQKLDLFTDPYKLNRQIKSVKSKMTERRYIRKIEKIDSVPTKCIEVASPNKLFLCSKHNIITHNSTSVCAYILWYVIFNKTKNVAILGNDGKIPQELLKKIQDSYEALPKWIQQGVKEWAKTSVEFENGCRIITGACTKTAIRGFTIHFMFIDEVAFIENWADFYTSVFNTMSNSKRNKIAMVSTINGMNHFYTFWQGAIDTKKSNGWHPIKVTWDMVPGRDVAWKEEILSATNYDYEAFSQEHECNAIGSSGTLIAGWKLKELEYLNQITPLKQSEGLYQYEVTQKNHKYVIVCDVSRGKQLDYSAFHVIDITSTPYKQVCIFRNNNITPLDYADIIYNTARGYNNAYVLVEINDIGSQVSEHIYYEFDYEYVLMTENGGRAGKKVTAGFGHKQKDFGVRTTRQTKNLGCSLLKLLIEQGSLELTDKYTYQELLTFSKKGLSYEAEQGNNDDLISALLLFAWLTDQQYFKDLTDINTLQELRDKTEAQIAEELLPFGFVVTGTDDYIDEDDIPTVFGNAFDRWLLE